MLFYGLVTVTRTRPTLTFMSMPAAKLNRGIGLLEATAANMLDMIGIGPFIAIPILLSKMNGPQALLGWLLAGLLAVCDGLVWAELGAAMPGSRTLLISER